MTEGKGNFTQIDRANVTLEKNASAPLKFRQVFFMKESKEPKALPSLAAPTLVVWIAVVCSFALA